MAVKLWSNRIEQFVDGTGVPRSGAKLFTYVGGSVNTKQTTYTESTGTTPNTNPIVLDSSGRIPQPIWLTTGVSYKFVLAPPTDTDPPTSPIDTLDIITGINDSSASQSEWISGPAPTFVSASQFTLVGDQTTNFAKSRRLKFTVTAGTVYGEITATAFAVLTTVTVALDSGSLDSGLSAVSYGIIAPLNPSIDADMVHRKGAAVASAATTDIWPIAGDYLHITGSTGPITSLGTAPYAGARREVVFDSTPTLTHNATSLILPGAANIVAAAGDRMIVRADTTANMNVIEYIKASGRPVINTANTQVTVQHFASGSGTYTTPATATRIKIRGVAGGGGGAGSGTGAANGVAGGNTTFSTLTANGGGAGQAANGAVGAGGTATGGNTVNSTGGDGDATDGNVTRPGGRGGSSYYGGGGALTFFGAVNGFAGKALGSGGGGAGAGGTTAGAGGGGGAGGYFEHWIITPAASYSYAVGAAGTGGALGTNGGIGGAGVIGDIVVEEFYD